MTPFLYRFKTVCSNFSSKIAIRDTTNSYSYQTLWADVNYLSLILKEKYLISEGDIVIHRISRGYRQIVAILATFLCNAVYFPLHLSISQERVQFLYSYTNTKCILDDTSVDIVAVDPHIICQDNYSHLHSQIGYLLSTSGTTGEPKLVCISYETLSHLIECISSFYNWSEKDIILQTSETAFHPHLREILGTLCIGATLSLLPSSGLLDSNLFLSTIEQHKVSRVYMVPSYWKIIYPFLKSNPSYFKSVKVVMFGGEVLRYNTVYQVKSISKTAMIENYFSPGETGMHALIYRINENDKVESKEEDSVPIAGEIRPFLEYEIAKESKLIFKGRYIYNGYYPPTYSSLDYFISGDIVSRNGNLLHYIGRNDSIIKYNGQKININEIEQVLLTYSIISSCKIIHFEGQLLCFYTTDSYDIVLSTEQVEKLKHILPTYMIPTTFVFISQFPITMTGKIDSTALIDYYNRTYKNVIDWSSTQSILQTLQTADPSIYLNDLNISSIHQIQLLCSLQSIHSDFKIKDFLEFSRLKDIQEFLSGIEINPTKKDDKAKLCNTFPLSSSQKRLAYDLNNKDVSKSYRLYSFSSNISYTKIKSRLKELIKNYELFRTRFKIQSDGQIIQYVVSYQDNSLVVETISKPSNVHLDEFISRLLNQIDIDIDTNIESCFQWKWIIGTTECYLLMICNHILFDGLTPSILFSSTLYHSVSYSYYVQEEEELFQQSQYTSCLQWWLSQIENGTSLISLPMQQSVTLPSCHYHRWLNLDNSLYLKMLKFVKEYRLTMMSYFISLLSILFQSLFSDSSFCITSLLNTRFFYRQFLNTPGCFVNTIIHPVFNQLNQSIQPYVVSQFKHYLESLSNGWIPFDHILKNSSNPSECFFQIGCHHFSYNNEYPCFNLSDDPNEEKGNPITFTSFRHTPNQLMFDFIIHPSSTNSTVKEDTILQSGFLLTYQSSLEPVFCESLLDRLILLIEQMDTLDHMSSLSSLSILLPEELPLPFVPSSLDCYKRVEDIIHEQVTLYSSKEAICFESEHITYQELWRRSNSIASKLMLYSSPIVVQIVERGPDMVIGMLAILIAGKTYCPYHPHDPTKRLQEILTNLSTTLILTTTTLTGIYKTMNKDMTIIPIDTYDDQSCHLTGTSSICYIITTSGSTGTPKFVPIEHLSLIEYTNAIQKHPYNWNSSVRNLQTCRCSFDVHLMDIYCTLMVGGTIVMLKEGGIYDSEYVYQQTLVHQVNTLTIVPSLIEPFYLLGKQWPNSIHTIAVSGEPLLKTHLLKLKNMCSSSVRVINFYGPAECTINCTGFVIPSLEDIDTLELKIPIGQPLNGYECLVTFPRSSEDDKVQDTWSSNPVPFYIPGDLYVRGHGVMKGYLNNDKNSLYYHSTYGGPFYKTGDKVYKTKDNMIYYVGRSDFQVKLQGQRIELFEIERVILSISSVEEVILLKHTLNNTEHLCCFVKSYSSNCKSLLVTIKETLQQSLPRYMIPTIWKILDSFPLTANNKINRDELIKNIFLEDDHTQKTLFICRNRDEEFILDIIKDIADTDTLYEEDHLINTLHLNSIQIMALLSRCRSHSSLKTIQLDVSSFLTHLSIRSLLDSLFSSPSLLPSFDRQLDDFQTFLDKSSLHISKYTVPHMLKGIYLDFLINTRTPNLYKQNMLFDIQSDLSILELQYKLTRALQYLIYHHSVLRSTFSHTRDTETREFVIYQQIQEINIESMKCNLSLFETIDSLHVSMTKQYDVPISISTGPLIRFSLFHCNSHSYFLIETHHIVYDHGCDHLFLSTLTDAFINEKEYELSSSTLPLQYIHFSVIDSNLQLQSFMSECTQYWIHNLSSTNPYQTIVPSSRSLKTKHRSGYGRHSYIDVSEDIYNRIQRLKKEFRMTSHTIWLSLFSLLIQKDYHPDHLFYIGSVQQNRYAQGSDQTFGYFLNLVPYIFRFDHQNSLQTKILYINQIYSQAIKFSMVDVKSILSQIKDIPTRWIAPYSSFVFTEVPSMIESELKIQNTQFIRNKQYQTQTAKCEFDFICYLYSFQSRYRLKMECSSDLYDETDLSQFQENLWTLIHTMF